MKMLYPGCSFAGIRGNVQTRLKKLAREDLDGTILAAAGLNRLGMGQIPGRRFTLEEMVPAAGQGILAVQGRKGETVPWLDAVQSWDSEMAALAERQFVRALDGGCTSPTAAHACVDGNELKLTGLYLDEKTGELCKAVVLGDVRRPRQLGERLARRLHR